MRAKSDRNASIIDAYRAGERSLGELAAEHGVSRQTLHAIVRKAHLDGQRIRGDREAARRDETDPLPLARQALTNTPGMTRAELAGALGRNSLPASVSAEMGDRLRSHRPRPDLFARGDYITALKSAAAGLGIGDLLTKKNYDEDRAAGEPSGSAVVLFFGSWNEGLKAAGLATNGRFRYGSRFDDSELIDILRDYISSSKSTSRPGYTRWRAGNQDLPSAGSIVARFEMWSEAVRQAVTP